MTNKVPDFKDSNGSWVYRFQDGEVRYFTNAGMLYHGMRQRCNVNGSKQKASPLYSGCTTDFVDFQDFANWCQAQVGYNEGYQLDKDLLVRGNKRYGKDTLVFIPQEINKLFTKRTRFRGDLPIGVTAEKGGNTYKASFTRGGKKVNLGNFKTSLEAFEVYKSAKEAYIKQQAEKWRDKIDPRAYNALMNYTVEITD